MPPLLDLWATRAAERPRIVVESLPKWTETEGKKHRLYLSGARRVIADERPCPVVCDAEHAAVDGRDLAKEWLRWLFHEQRRKSKRGFDKRIGVRTRDLSYLAIPHPIHYAGVSELPEAGLVDITACYFNLYRRLPLDLTYDPGRAFGLGRFWWIGHPEMEGDKFGRNVALGITRARRFTMWEKGVRVEGSPWANRYLCPGQWGFIVDVLHTIAGEFVDRGGVHWHTDGGILPAGEAEGFRTWLAEMWGLDSTVEYGSAHISGVGAWRIGEQVRKTWTLKPKAARSNVRRDLPPSMWLAQCLAAAGKVAP